MGSKKKARREAENRASVEDPKVPISSDAILAFLGIDALSDSGERVSIESALGVPAIFAAVNFLAGTLASLPLNVYRRTSAGREKVKNGVASILHDVANDEQSSFDWRKFTFDQVFTGGRAYSFIERSDLKRPLNIWPLDPAETKVRRKGGRTTYEYRDGRRTLTYEASEIIDIPFMLKANRRDHRSPILTNKDVVGLAQAATKYGSKFFQNGGVPPFAITGNITTPGGLQRSADDLTAAVKKAAKERRLALSLPAGHEIKPLGVDPEKSQLVELQRFLIEQFARVYSLPPVFLQDLTHGTFSNTEQQDLHLVKHTIMRWAKQFEQELNLKLFGRNNNRIYAELNLDGMLRGDFKTRMEGNARAIQTGQLTPDEAREMENRPAMGGAAAQLVMQGAMMPIDKLGQQPARGIGDNGGPPLDEEEGKEKDAA